MNDAVPVSFTRRASRHVEEAGRWWRENRAKAPDALAEELARALELIASQPQVGAIARNVALPGVRRVLLGRVKRPADYRRIVPVAGRLLSATLQREAGSRAQRVVRGDFVLRDP